MIPSLHAFYVQDNQYKRISCSSACFWCCLQRWRWLNFVRNKNSWNGISWFNVRGSLVWAWRIYLNYWGFFLKFSQCKCPWMAIAWIFFSGFAPPPLFLRGMLGISFIRNGFVLKCPVVFSRSRGSNPMTKVITGWWDRLPWINTHRCQYCGKFP